MRTAVLVALVALAGCERAPGYIIAECRDDYSGQLFRYDSRLAFDPVVNLSGESYISYRMGDGRVIRVTDSWANTHCRILENHQR